MADDWGNETMREFWVPPAGGYVREVDASRPGTLGRQVCKQLGSRGYTLIAAPDSLLSMVRREYRKCVAAAKRNNT